MKRDLLPNLEELVCSRGLDGRCGRVVPREDLDRVRGRDRPARVAHRQLGGVGAGLRVGVARGWGGGCNRGRAVAKVPQVGQRVAVRVPACGAVEIHRQRYGSVVRAGRLDGGGRGLVGGAGVSYAVELPITRVGGVVEGLARTVGSEGHGDRAAGPHPRGELARYVRAPALGLELEDLVAHVVAIKVRVVVGGRPGGAGWHKRLPRYRRAAGVGGAVLVDGRRIGCSCAVLRAGAGGVVVVALADVPAVVRSRLTEVHLVPSRLADVAYEEAGSGGVGIHGEAEGIPQTVRESLLAVLARVGLAGEVTPSTVGSLVGVGRRYATVAGYAQDLGQEVVGVAWRVGALALAGRLALAAPVAHANVEVAILAEVQISCVMAAERRDVVYQNGLARRINGVAGHDETRDPVYGVGRVGGIERRAGTKLVV